MRPKRGFRALAVLLCLFLALFAAACTADIPTDDPSGGGTGGTEQPGGGEGGGDPSGGSEGGSGEEGEGGNEGNEGETDPPAPQEYDISFWSAGLLYYTLTTAGNEVLTLPDEPARTGYTFTGWFFDETAQTQPFDAYTYANAPLTQDEDVYAGWSRNTYMVTFDTDGGSAVSPLETARIESADSLPVPQKQGFLFAGWYLDAGLKTAVTYPYVPTGDVTFYAKWEQEPSSSASFTVDASGVLTAAEASGDVVIPEQVNGVTVTQIGQRVFANNAELTSVTLPDTVRIIGLEAFSGCKNLASADLGEGVEVIHERAFSGCSSLAAADFPDTLKEIRSSAFENCGLTAVSLNKVQTLRAYVFAGCTRLSALDLGSVRSLGQNAFAGCTALTRVSLPATVAESGGYLFRNCSSLNVAELPASGIPLQYTDFDGTPCAADTRYGQDGLLLIDGYLFGVNEDFKSTEELRLPQGTVAVTASALNGRGGGAGYVYSLASVVFPQSIRCIGEKAFAGCTRLASVTVPQGVKLNSVGEDAFEGTALLDNDANWEENGLYLANWLIAVKDTAMDSFTVKEGTEYIVNSSARLFSATAAAELQSLSLPSTLKGIGEKAFMNLAGLTSVTLPEGLEQIGGNAFANCSSLAQVNLGACSALTEIGSGAFGSCALTSVTIPASVQVVGDFAFNFNDALKIYCEAAEQPGGWGSKWNYCRGSALPVEWGNVAP